MKNLSNTPLSVLDLVPIREGGTVRQAFEHSLALARHIERLGYQRHWVAEHHGIPSVASAATSVLIGYLAQGTSTLRIGSGGIMLPNHAPLIIAEQFGTLDALYPNRIDLGLGRAPGADSLTMQALRRDPVAAGRDFPQQLHELQAFLAPARPGQRLQAIPGAGAQVPIWLLGSSDFSARLAAQLGLPFSFAAHFAPALMHEAITLYRQYFRPSATLNKPYLMLGLNVIAAPTDEEAQFLSTTAQQKFLGLLRGQPRPSQAPVKDMDAIWNEQEKHAIQRTFKEAIVGGPETVAKRLEHIIERTQADELIITSDFFDAEHRQRSYEIIMQVKRQSLLEW